MVIGIFGENCTGKSTIARQVSRKHGCFDGQSRDVLIEASCVSPEAAEKISEYVGAFDEAMKAYFARLDDPRAAEQRVRQIHSVLENSI